MIDETSYRKGNTTNRNSVCGSAHSVRSVVLGSVTVGSVDPDSSIGSPDSWFPNSHVSIGMVGGAALLVSVLAVSRCGRGWKRKCLCLYPRFTLMRV